MFRFDTFRKPESQSQPLTTKSSPTNAIDSTETTGSEKSASFLQRMTSADTLLGSAQATIIKRPSFSSLQNSFSSSSSSSLQSFSIPVPTNSWGMLMLNRLQDADDSEFEDISNLLLAGDKATLLLPVSQPSHPSAIIDRDFIQDHVVVCQNSSDMSQVISLSGIRGTFQHEQFVALGVLPNEKEISSIMLGTPIKKSLFDTFNLDVSSITLDYPKYNILASHVQLPLRGTKTITVMLIQKPISKDDVVEWETTRRKQKDEKPASIPDSRLMSRAEEFAKKFRKNTPRNLDQASYEFIDFLESLAADMDGDESEVDEQLDQVETFLCHSLYDKLFSIPGSDTLLQDEALESRIAALNLLDLNMEHLGVTIEGPEETASIEALVKRAGVHLQQLDSIQSSKEKLEALITTHQVIADAIEEFAAKERNATLNEDSEVVQEIIQAISVVHEEQDSSDRGKEKQDKENPLSTSNESDHNKVLPTPPPKSTDSQSLRSASADVLLPLLIFTIVRSNPTKFLSNLKFVQRFRRPSCVSGQANYCLTNMLAAVSFLETTNLVGLGLSADRVFSHVTDLNAPATPPKTSPLPDPPNEPSTTTSNASSVGGMKLVNEVMDSSYKVFDGIGRLWQRSSGDTGKAPAEKTTAGPSTPTGKMMEEMNNIINRSRSAAVDSELKDMSSNSSKISMSAMDAWDNVAAHLLNARNAKSRAETFQTLLQAPSQLLNSVTSKSNDPYSDGPIQKFLDMKSIDELKIGEVAELLADYKRLAAIIKQAGLA